MIGSTFTMNDGVITGNRAVWGGGIDVGQDPAAASAAPAARPKEYGKGYSPVM